MITRADALGRTISLARPPARVLSLVPSQTELLAHLGLDEEVVGITRYCVHPAGWLARKAIVGGTKTARLARARDLRPDLILANKEENTRDDVEALEALAPAFVTDVRDLPGCLAMIADVGALVGRASQADALCDEIRGAFAALPTFARRRALYLIWRKPWMGAGADTFIHDLMGRAGYDNALAHLPRYPTLEPEALAALAPEEVLLSSEPYPFGEAHVAELAALLPGARVRLVDGEMFSWYGSRMRLAPDYLKRLRDEP